MHLIEAAGLHQELSNIAIVSPAAPTYSEKEFDIRRRIYWVAWSLNTLTSCEYGRSRVRIPDTSVKLFDTKGASSYTEVLVTLATRTVWAEDKNVRDSIQTSLTALNWITTNSEPLNLLKADVAFSLYRNLRSLRSPRDSISAKTAASVISIGISALPFVSSLAAQRTPWWTVISVPFQLLCILLAVDSRESLAHISTTMNVLEEVGLAFNTHMTREAVGCANLLVRLSRKRKEEDLKSLNVSPRSGPRGPLDAVNGQGPTLVDGLTQVQRLQPGIMGGEMLSGASIPSTINWADGLSDIEIPDDLNIDWSKYVCQQKSNAVFVY